MLAAKLKYGFISTYNRTIFLKQEVIGGVWTIAFSRPIRNVTEGKWVEDRDYRDNVSLRECFFYLVNEAERDHMANNQLPREQWIKL